MAPLVAVLILITTLVAELLASSEQHKNEMSAPQNPQTLLFKTQYASATEAGHRFEHYLKELLSMMDVLVMCF